MGLFNTFSNFVNHLRFCGLLFRRLVLERYKKLNLAPYKGFINPVYELVTDKDGNITDVTVSYDEDYVEQMLRYSKDYSPLPSVNN